GLATGRTMESVYDLLAKMHKNEGLDFSGCQTFNLDEYIGVPPDDEHSYRYYMNKHLFSRVNIKIENTHLPNGMAIDLKAECRAYEDCINRLGGIDVQLLGIGEDGHIGFNEPLSSLRSRTRDKALTPETRRQNCAMFGGNPDNVPARALTMGVGTILDARRVFLLATGEKKADILAKAVEGPITSMISTSALQLHPACTIICDESAASKLQCKDYYYWIFENEPEWKDYN
ncbi:MAG: glucosamine-6-phosphate deaminase, partial [SAR324 cluster bacterium]|nr:glucosamine-6-phosphate deaminase [SAR324 cluster bacterium]